jgi:hypothetical protein
MFFNKSKKLLEQSNILLQQTQKELREKNSLLKASNDFLDNVQRENEILKLRYSSFIDKDFELSKMNEELDKLNNGISLLNEKYKYNFQIFTNLEQEINLYHDTLDIGSFGLYQPQFDYQTSENYKNAIEYNYEKQKQLIKNDKATICHTEWTVGGSKSEGKKMTNQYKKLMLFAFNGECDGCISRVKWNNAAKTTERIQKAFDNINKLGMTQNVSLTTELLDLKFEEMALFHEYDLKLHAEKEEQRRIRDLMREEEKAQREFERAQRDAEDEERRFQKALDKARQDLGIASEQDIKFLNEQILLLELKLKEAQARKERAISLAQQTKVGHIYVISNVGSFGEDIFKIGLTRRLDPLDRVRELGDASVPFHFDVHAIIYSENAPQLEYEIHRKFDERRLNRINGRREFFKVSLSEIEEVVKQHSDAEIQFTQIAEAREYRETLTLLEKLNNCLESEIKAKFPDQLV